MLAACDADAFCFVNFSCTDYENIQRFCWQVDLEY
jgi:hypothetical protein